MQQVLTHQEELRNMRQAGEHTLVGTIIFADKTDGGGHRVFVGRNPRKVIEPKGADQRVMFLPYDDDLLERIRKGDMPAMSMAALLLYMNTQS